MFEPATGETVLERTDRVLSKAFPSYTLLTEDQRERLSKIRRDLFDLAKALDT